MSATTGAWRHTADPRHSPRSRSAKYKKSSAILLFRIEKVEMRNIRDFVTTLDPVPVLGHCFHSYSQLWLWPYGYAYNAYPENKEEVQQLAIDASDALFQVHGTFFDPINSADLCKPKTRREYERMFVIISIYSRSQLQTLLLEPLTTGTKAFWAPGFRYSQS